MSLLLRTVASILNIIAMVVNTLANLFVPKRKPDYPPITNPILRKPVMELRELISQKKVLFFASTFE